MPLQLQRPRPLESPVERTLAEEREVTVGDTDVDVYIYAEEYTYSGPVRIIKRLLGQSSTYVMRCIEADASKRYRSTYAVNDISLEDQLEELLLNVAYKKQRKDELSDKVL